MLHTGSSFAAVNPDATGALVGAVSTSTSGTVTGVLAAAGLGGDLAPKSASAVLMEAYSGQVLFAKNEHERRPIASVTKVMTLCLIFDAIESGKIRMNDRVSASHFASSFGGSQIWLEPGEQMGLRDLIVAIAVGSANDACVAVAEHIAGTHDRFVQMMNDKAAQLGMNNTNFVNPHGLDDPNHYSSAYDVALMARYATRYPDLLKFTSIWLEYLRDGKTMQSNHNRLVRYYQGCDGLKTGYTSLAGNCLAATAVRDGTRLLSVVLGAPSSDIRFAEGSGLLNAGFANYYSVPLAKKGETVAVVPVERGTISRIALVCPSDFGVILPKGTQPQLTRKIVRQERIFAPIEAGQVVAELVIEAGGKEVGRTPLLATVQVPRASLLRLMWKALSAMIKSEPAEPIAP
jgi:D-alanyl-D-alanine carboxypeptidase (penicillin-binding protein 5/6)